MLLFLLQIGVVLALAAACARPSLRGPVGLGAFVAGAMALGGAAVAGSAERTLQVQHRFPAYVGLEVQSKAFAIEVVQAPGWQWLVCVGVFCLLWGAWFSWRQKASSPFGAPLVLAWTGCALLLALQKTAAPAELVAPFDLGPDRFLLPASLAAGWLLAERGGKILPVFFYLSLFLSATRLPLAIFGTLATQNGWGTHFDVHDTLFIASPVEREAIELQPASTQQIGWMVWAPQLLVYPAIYFLSVGGTTFFLLMARRQRAVDVARAAMMAAVLLLPAIAPAQQAQDSKKDQLLLFESPTSRWSRRLQEEVWSKPAFAAARERFTIRRQDGDKVPALARRFDVDRQPTILLLDPHGRIYARTGYRAGGPLLFDSHLQTLQRIRERRDKLLEQASKATGRDKAGFLAAAIDALPEDIPLDDYRKHIEEIVQLDVDNRGGLRDRFRRQLQDVDDHQGLRTLTQKADSLAAEGKWQTIDAAVKDFLDQKRKTPLSPGLHQRALWLQIGVARQGKQENKLATLLEAVVKADASSTLGKQAQRLLSEAATSRPSKR